jgi:hypothetical protein
MRFLLHLLCYNEIEQMKKESEKKDEYWLRYVCFSVVVVAIDTAEMVWQDEVTYLFEYLESECDFCFT